MCLTPLFRDLAPFVSDNLFVCDRGRVYLSVTTRSSAVSSLEPNVRGCLGLIVGS